MTQIALDSSAVVAWLLLEEPRWRAVDALINQPSSEILLPGPTLTEIIVATRRRGNTSTGALITQTLEAIGMRIAAPTKPDLLRAAALLEQTAAHPGTPPTHGGRLTLSLADAVILAIVERLSIPILTFDRYWLDLAREGMTSATIVSI